jgi:hypothetical protein
MAVELDCWIVIVRATAAQVRRATTIIAAAERGRATL